MKPAPFGIAPPVRRIAGLVLPALCLGAPAFADDSSAAIGVGGIVFQKNDQIVMEAEQLDLGQAEVRVRFVFRNTGAADIETMVAFPLPDIAMAALFNEPMGLPRKDVNFVGFSVTADGVAIEPETTLEATVEQESGESVDVTDILGPYLKSHGPGEFSKAALSKDMLDRAAARGVKLLEDEDSDAYPTWTVHTKFHWLQRFPVGQPVVLEHRYHPILGAHYSAFEPGEDERAAYCVEPATEAEATRRIAAAGKIAKARHKDGAELAFQTRELAYVLETGANWHGPITDFRLTLETGDPDILVASCFPGLVRSGPTAWAMSRSDYTPDRDFAVALGRIDWSTAQARSGGTATSVQPVGLDLAPAGPYLIADSDTVALGPAELSIRGPEFLRYARNEIFARHGYVFQDKSLADWFARWPWYHPQPGPVVLSALEKANVAVLETAAKQLPGGPRGDLPR